MCTPASGLHKNSCRKLAVRCTPLRLSPRALSAQAVRYSERAVEEAWISRDDPGLGGVGRDPTNDQMRQPTSAHSGGARGHDRLGVKAGPNAPRRRLRGRSAPGRRACRQRGNPRDPNSDCETCAGGASRCERDPPAEARGFHPTTERARRGSPPPAHGWAAARRRREDNASGRSTHGRKSMHRRRGRRGKRRKRRSGPGPTNFRRRPAHLPSRRAKKAARPPPYGGHVKASAPRRVRRRRAGRSRGSRRRASG